MQYLEKSFFDGFAEEYEEPKLSDVIWEALIYTKYPIERFIEKEEVNDWGDCASLSDVLQNDPSPYVSLSFVEDAFIWLLNAYGAQITLLEEKEDIPMICNWTCHGFQTVGYGCFW